MVGLTLLALASILSQPFDPQTWSLFAAKFIVPFTLFHLSMLVFNDGEAPRRFEAFSLLVLAYLCFTAIAFLANAKAFIFPRFILDESLGIHTDRARGPFLQAVPNGVTITMLGLIALDSFRRGRVQGFWAVVLLISLPLAILATMTRAVWIAFAVSTVILLFHTSSRRLRRACLSLVVAGAIGLGAALCSSSMQDSLQDRATERGPVEIRIGVYKAGWKMFLERPISGWGVNQMPAELADRMSDYHLRVFWVHNTYLEILVEHGVAGLLLYAVIMVGLFRLGRERAGTRFNRGSFPDKEFRRIWPILLAVYLFNATFVVMNYQFVNGLLFTIAGMLAAQDRQSAGSRTCVVAS
jgi:putative inorganic carbon (HCO3(-)) transporter